MVVAPGAEGDFGVLPRHSLVHVGPAAGRDRDLGGRPDERRIFVGGGFAEVNERGCTVLAEEAMPVEEIDLEQARRRLSDAQDDLREAKDDVERARGEREIRVAEAQIQAAGG